MLKLIRERYKIEEKLALMIKYSLPDRGVTEYAIFPKELEISEAASDEEAKVRSEGPHNIYVKVQRTLQQEHSDEGVFDDSQDDLEAMLEDLNDGNEEKKAGEDDDD